MKNYISAKSQLLKKNSDEDYKYLLTETTPETCRNKIEIGKSINHIKKLKPQSNTRDEHRHRPLSRNTIFDCSNII